MQCRTPECLKTNHWHLHGDRPSSPNAPGPVHKRRRIHAPDVGTAGGEELVENRTGEKTVKSNASIKFDGEIASRCFLVGGFGKLFTNKCKLWGGGCYSSGFTLVVERTEWMVLEPPPSMILGGLWLRVGD